jgi:aminoglycoside 2''-phosphotransferase
MNIEKHSLINQIQNIYPDLVTETVRQIEGWGQFSVVLVINETYIFRFPRTSHSAQFMLRELEILDALQGKTSLPIPKPEFRHYNKDGLVFMGYTMIKGEPVAHDTLQGAGASVLHHFAAQLAGFLREIHAIPSTNFKTELAVGGSREEWQTLYREFQAKLFSYMRPDAQETVRREFESALNNVGLWDFQPVFHHGDFGTGNILYNPSTMQVTGVIDFTFAGMGDPAQDIGAVWSLGDSFMERFFTFYPEIQQTIPRVKFIRSTYALQQALYALRDGNKEDFDDGIQDYI